MPPAISVVIPSVRGRPALAELVSRILLDSRLGTEVLIADNGLQAPVAAELRERGARVLTFDANLGFAAAVNRGAREATGEFLVLLNDDAMPAEGCDVPGELVSAARDGALMVAGVLLQERNPNLIESAGIELDAAFNPHDYLFNQPVTKLEQGVAPPLAPCGGAACFRRSTFLDVGGFDEGFFAYFEDIDLALRLRRRGVRCEIAPRARLVHTGSVTLGSHSLEKAAVVGFSRGYFLHKYGVLGRPTAAARVLAVELATCAVLARRHRSFEPVRARLRGWRHCAARERAPEVSVASVGMLDGLRRRYRRGTPAPDTHDEPIRAGMQS